MNLKKMLLLCLLTCALCACNQDKETNTEVTPAEVSTTPEATGLPENTKVPSVTEGPAGEGEIAIDEAHFGDKVFCEYLKKNYDSDTNGYFSEEEIQSIKNLSLKSYRQMTTPYTELKGFSYFTALESLVLNSADAVIVSGVPKLQWISIETYKSYQTVKFGGVIIEDCPELEHISIYSTVFQSKGETEEPIFSIKDCVNLKGLHIIDSDFGNVLGTISGTPDLKISISDSSVPPKKLSVDADTYFSLTNINVTEREVLLPEWVELRWSEEDTSFPLEKGLTELERVLNRTTESFSVRVEEVTPAFYDENGRKAYYAMMDSSRVAKDGYEFNRLFEVREEYDAYYNSILLYSDQKPVEEAFSILWDDEIDAKNGTYSAVRGMQGVFTLFGNVSYLNDGVERVLGSVSFAGEYEINKDGELRIYNVAGDKETAEFGDYTSGPMWLKEKSPVTPAPEEDAVLIDRTHFSNLFFREYLKDVVDLDRDGYLSLEERQAITKLDLGFMDTGADYLDGFEWFPNLQHIYCNPCRKLVCKNCPELTFVAVFDEGKVTDVEIENCPKLGEGDVHLHAYYGCEGGIAYEGGIIY